MNNDKIRKLSGFVTLKVTGSGGERFINALIREGISVWNIARLEKEVLSMQVLVRDHAQIRDVATEYLIHVEILDRSGLPAFLQRVKSQWGFIIGIILGLGLLYFLSNMIWHVEIRGASPELEYKLMKQLRELGVYEGGLKFLVDDPQALQKTLTSLNEEITWIGVENDGTAFFFQVVEKERPEVEGPEPPRHLVAKKEAVIVDYFVEKGEPVISINQFVKPGQILVSGLIGQEDAPEIVSAKGKVWGKTWYKSEAQVKMKAKTERLSGNKYEKRFLQIGSLRIPIAGMTFADYNNKEVNEVIQRLKILDWQLPLAFVEQTVYELETVELKYTEDEARKLAIEIAQKDVLKDLSTDAKIVNHKILHERMENDTFKISILFDVVEDIAVEQMIR